MTVVEGWFAGKSWPRPPTLEELPEAARHSIAANIAINSKVGSSKRAVLLSLCTWKQAWGLTKHGAVSHGHLNSFLAHPS